MVGVLLILGQSVYHARGTIGSSISRSTTFTLSLAIPITSSAPAKCNEPAVNYSGATTLKNLGISLGRNGIFARLSPGDLYLLDVDAASINGLSLALYTTPVNPEALKYWHEVTGHVGEQNIKLLPELVDGVDLSKPPDLSGDCKCVICAETRMKLKPHKGHMKPGLYQNELIHSDIVGPIDGAKSDARYVVTFTEDITRKVDVALMPSKECEVVLRAFQGYAKKIFSPDRPIRRLHTDDDGAYSGGLFNNYRYAEGIRWESTIPYSPQMNPIAERMGQTLSTRAHAMLLQSGLPRTMITELIATAAFMHNIMPVTGVVHPVTGKPATPNEAAGHGKPDLSFVKRVGRRGMCQERKLPRDNWDKFQPRAVEGRMVGYEPHGFYRMLMPNGHVQRYDHVEWLEDVAHEPKRKADHPLPARHSVPRQGETIAVDFSSSKRMRLGNDDNIDDEFPATITSIQGPRITELADDDITTEDIAELVSDRQLRPRTNLKPPIVEDDTTDSSTLDSSTLEESPGAHTPITDSESDSSGSYDILQHYPSLREFSELLDLFIQAYVIKIQFRCRAFN